jgi:hypothetical protein
MLLRWHRVFSVVRGHVNVFVFVFVIFAASLALEVGRTFVLVGLAILCIVSTCRYIAQ